MQRDEDGVSPFFRPCLGHITTATIIMMNLLQAYKQSNFLSRYNISVAVRSIKNSKQLVNLLAPFKRLTKYYYHFFIPLVLL